MHTVDGAHSALPQQGVDPIAVLEDRSDPERHIRFATPYRRPKRTGVSLGHFGPILTGLRTRALPLVVGPELWQ